VSRVLLAGLGPWTTALEEAIRSVRGMSLASRCEELADLRALAAAGVGDLAVVSGELSGLDLDSVSALHRSGVTVIAVAASPDAQEWLGRLGVDRAVRPFTDVSAWSDVLSGPSDVPTRGAATGSCLAVWGPPGGPGATTVAVSLALASAASGVRTLLVDLDPAGASIAQQLGLTDSGSGVERACRAAQAGALTPAAFDSLTYATDLGLEVLTGVLRPDRWVDLRQSALEAVMDLARRQYGRVVCDVGSDVYDVAHDLGAGSPRPSTATAVGIDAADHLVLVGSADSVGLARLLRGVDRLVLSASPPRRTHVVVNRWRPSAGWSPGDLVRLLGDVAPSVQTSVLPDDTAAADAASLCGGSPWLCREAPGKDKLTPLGSALHEMTAAVLGVARGIPVERWSRVRR
jgi:MinD-like ATPase involved in chromosome partitioning or flagellar assembly